MILQSLCKYYERRQTSPEAGLAPQGFEYKAIPFVLEITLAGKLVGIVDTRRGDGKRRWALSECVPQALKKTSAIVANYLWDNAEYVLGIDSRGNPLRVKQQHAEFIRSIRSLQLESSDPGIAAVLAFLHFDHQADLQVLPCWGEILETNPLMTFRIHGEGRLVCQSPQVREALSKVRSGSGVTATCLLTGDHAEIERLHPAIKGVWGSQSVGANVVSFNLEAFRSYGKTQGFNAPIGSEATFAYTTALNHLLSRGSNQRIQLGDTSTIFWAGHEHPLEQEFALLAGISTEEEGFTSSNQAIHTLLEKSNRPQAETDKDGDCAFYVLGMAPNVARISIRFWYAGTVNAVMGQLAGHYEYLRIVRQPYEPEFLPFWLLLKSIALMGKVENIPASLAGEMTRCILEGLPYPQTILSSVIRRIRAEKGKNDISTGKPMQGVDYPRAALLKAYINRLHPEEKLTVALDKDNLNPGYRLGRLFALFERIQEVAGNRQQAVVIKNYYGIASGTPITAFPLMFKLKSHHISKFENFGQSLHFENTLDEIMSGITDFPASLGLLDQGRFAVGYYHQRHDLTQSHGGKHAKA